MDTSLDFWGSIDITLEEGTTTGYGYSRLTLTAETVDWQAEEYFGRYHCHWLAGAIHTLTGWQPITFDAFNGPRSMAVHSGVLTPDGQVLDIFGVRPVEDVEAFYQQALELPTRHRRVACVDMPGDVITDRGCRGDRFWWARKLPPAGLATYLHFARHLVCTHIGEQHLLPTEVEPAPAAPAAPDPRTSPSFPASSGGSSMSGIDEIRGVLSRAVEMTEQAQHALAEAARAVDGARQAVAQVAQNSSRDEVQQVLAQYGATGDAVHTAGGQLAVSADQIRTYAAQL
ncbi:DUF3813 domain-containing protein [Saccharopolyspora sp. 6V]|uniref:DUF3813 domain-containing protein n=1 Tax=Saccharopolyspora sp. 6V TaxID=2877239 RepID=UPI001CD6614D|nr:DUF3813 domain-containing protein [Saccharopolyspora sp. 6V]MCA1194176.1 hypothetical protein [Saccharopolyspora sp. 6V]